MRLAYRSALEALSVDLSVSLRNIVRHQRRTLAGSMAVILGVVALMLAAGFIEWIYSAMREGTIHAGLGHIQIVKRGYLERGTADPFAYMLPDDSPDAKIVAAAPGVAQVAPRLKFTGLISFHDESLSFLGEGLDTDREVGGRYGTLMESGAPLANADPTGIILGMGLAKNLGVNVGDTVVLVVNKRGGALGGVEAKVRGTFSTPTKAYDDVAAQVPYALAKEVLQVDAAHAWVMYLHETAMTVPALDFLRTRLSADLQAVPWFETADFYNKTVRLFSRQVLVMKLIIGLVVILSISNTMMMSVMERTNEIATAMAVGVRRGRVLSQFLIEGLLIGVAGGAMGIGLGYALAHVISVIGIPMPPPPGMARGFIGEILVTPSLAWQAMLLATLTALIASIHPAWRASRMVIVDALRHGR